MNKPDQSASVMFQARTPDDGSIFLPVSVYLGLSHSLVLQSLFLFFFFFFFFLFCFLFSFLSSSFSRRLFMHKSRQKEKSLECRGSRWQMVAKYKESKLGPRPPARISRKLPWKICQFFLRMWLSKYTHKYACYNNSNSIAIATTQNHE